MSDRSQQGTWLLCGALSVSGFALDVLTPLGASAGVLYLLMTALSVRLVWTASSAALAAAATLLALAGLPFALTPETSPLVELARRALVAAAAWATAGGARVFVARTAAGIASAARLETVIRTAVDGVVMIDPWGTVLLFNPACEQMFGYKAGEVLGRNVKMLMAADVAAEHDGYLGRYLETGRAGIIGKGREVFGRRKDGTLFPMDLAVGEARSVERFFVGVVRDISRRKVTDDELRRRARELAASNAELEQFAYVASHDLQEPLRKIRMYGELLADEHAAELGGEGAAYIEVMVDAAARLQRLIDDVLTYSRLSRRSGPIGVVDLDRVMSTTLSDLDLRIAEAGAEVTVDPLPRIPCDAGQFGQLFQNLVGNALKYRHPERTPRVHIGSERLESAALTPEAHGPAWRIAIEDNGIGFDPAYAEHIFEPFRRLVRRDQYQGTGIGLAICRRIVERHGGRISAESRPGEGTTVIILLPDTAG